MALTPQRKKELRKYLAGCPGPKCRVTLRHDFPLPMEWGKTDKLEIAFNRAVGSYELRAYCLRDCGAVLTYGVDRRTGVPVRRRVLSYEKDGYRWLGGDGYPMDPEERAYLLALLMEEANARLPFPVVSAQ